MAEAGAAVLTSGGPPLRAIEGKNDGSGPKQGVVPNRFKASVGEGFDPTAVEAAGGEMMQQLYGELRRLAAVKLRNLPPGRQTLQPTGLVHEVYLRLVKDHVDTQRLEGVGGTDAGKLQKPWRSDRPGRQDHFA